MKNFKILLIVIAVLLGFIYSPDNVSAEVKVMDLNETLVDKGLTPKDKNYKENDKQVKVYLFRWANCGHCLDFLEFLNSITPEYGYMFKLRSYETSMNEDNAKVYERVGKFLGHEGTGVPFIVVGNKYIYGFGSDSGTEFLNYLKEEYNKEVRYDVFDELDKKETENKEKEKNNTFRTVVWLIPIIVTIIGGVILLAVKESKK